MITELIQAFILIFLAEMGDKTQILAMAFATKFKIKHVVIGIFVGSLFNHAIAILLGSNLSLLIPLQTLSIIAGVCFVGFGLWNLLMDDEEPSNAKKYIHPIFTVALAFFIGELGDKTQLTAIVLSMDATYPLLILTGTVLGMVVTGLVGIIIGIKIGHKIDEFYIKVGASTIFIVVGTLKLYTSIPSNLINPFYVTIYAIVIIGLTTFLLYPTVQKRRTGYITSFQQTATKLHDYYTNMYEQVGDICLGENTCGSCGGTNCLVGYTKKILQKAKEGKSFNQEYIEEHILDKQFDRKKVLQALVDTVLFLKDDWQNKEMESVHHVRYNLERIMYSTIIEADKFSDYLDHLEQIDIKFKDLLLKN